MVNHKTSSGHPCVSVYLFRVVITFRRLGVNRVWLPILFVANQAEIMSQVWSRESSSAVPSRVGPLMFHTQVEYSVFSYSFHRTHHVPLG